MLLLPAIYLLFSFRASSLVSSTTSRASGPFIGCSLCAIIDYMRRTNFYFPDQMLERLKRASEQLGIPVSEIIRRAVEEYLKRLAKNQ